MDICAEQLTDIIKQAITESRTVEKLTLTIEEATKISGIGRDKLMELARCNNDFPSFKVGAKFLINREMLIKWLEKISNEGRVL